MADSDKRAVLQRLDAFVKFEQRAILFDNTRLMAKLKAIIRSTEGLLGKDASGFQKAIALLPDQMHTALDTVGVGYPNDRKALCLDIIGFLNRLQGEEETGRLWTEIF